jgi:hypothetical protein
MRRLVLALTLVLACAAQEAHSREDCSKSKFPNTCLKKYYVRVCGSPPRPISHFNRRRGETIALTVHARNLDPPA